MRNIHVGAKVRIYYSEHTFDEGEATEIDDGFVTVDFLDWIERWPADKLVATDVLFVEVFVPVGPGEIVKDFRR